MLKSTCDLFMQNLVKRNILTNYQIEVVKEEQKFTNDRFDEICIKLGFIEEKKSFEILSEISGYDYFFDEKTIKFEIFFNILDVEIQKKYDSIIFDYFENILKIAMCDPEDLLIKDQIIQKVKSKINNSVDIKFFYISKENLKNIYKKLSSNNSNSFNNIEKIADSINEIFQKAIDFNASDIHFTPDKFTVCVKFRIDGVITDICNIHKSVWENFLVRLKILSNLDISESRRPQSGHFEENICGKICDFRISTHPTIFGENVAIRILQKNKHLRSLNELGFTKDTIDLLKKTIEKPSGLIIICGPTGSGKTTTLYTLCSLLDSNRLNIMTLEDPVEYQLKNIKQTEILKNGLLTFADGIKSILRQDPDVIFIGEIRDEETAKMALRAAMTGHLVFSTLHVSDVLRVPNRLYDLGVTPSLLSGQLLLLMSQRLVKKLCQKCLGKKCEYCKDGFSGRVAISETLLIDNELDTLISEKKSINEIYKAAIKNGFKTMYNDGLQKIEGKLTTLEEITRTVPINKI